MADFVNTSNNKTAVRELSTQISDISGFIALVQGVIDDNPWSCTDYTLNSVSQAGVQKSREYYTGKVTYSDTSTGKKIGQITVKSPTSTAFTANIDTVLTDTELETGMGGSASHDSGLDKYCCTLKCHDSNGEIYYVAFYRDKIRISSFEDSDILSTIESWADALPALA